MVRRLSHSDVIRARTRRRCHGNKRCYLAPAPRPRLDRIIGRNTRATPFSVPSLMYKIWLGLIVWFSIACLLLASEGVGNGVELNTAIRHLRNEFDNKFISQGNLIRALQAQVRNAERRINYLYAKCDELDEKYHYSTSLLRPASSRAGFPLVHLLFIQWVISSGKAIVG